MTALLISVFIIIALDFLVSMSEAAITATPIHRARLLAKKSVRGQALVRLKESSERSITTLTSLSNLITIVGSVAVGAGAVNFLGEEWVWLFAMALTFIIMVAGEIVPKKIGEQYSLPIATSTAPFVLVLSKLFLPLTFVITEILRPALGHEKTPSTSKEEIAYLASIGGAEGIIQEYENQIIQRVFKLNDISAVDMMTPRPFVFMLDGNRTLGEATNEIVSAAFSKIPIYEESPDKVVGVARQSALLRAIVCNEQGRQVKEFIEEPLIIPESRLGDHLLKDFQESKQSFGIVVDGRGHVTGVVTLKDIIQELVGEILRERDIAPDLLKRLSKTEVLVHGQTQIAFLNRFFNIGLPNHRTVSGFLLDEIGHIPKPGTSFRLYDLEFSIDSVDHGLIEKVRVRKPDDVPVPRPERKRDTKKRRGFCGRRRKE